MTTECIVFHKTDRGNLDLLRKLYRIINEEVSSRIELEAVAISKITRKYKAFSNINAAMRLWQCGRAATLRPGDHVVFLLGKNWHMNKTDIRQYLSAESKDFLKNFDIMFPEWPDGGPAFFTDLE